MIALILTLALVGFLVWLITTYIPMPEAFKKAIIVIVIILLVLYIIRLFGFDIPLSRVN
jgi:hypothetical protein